MKVVRNSLIICLWILQYTFLKKELQDIKKYNNPKELDKKKSDRKTKETHREKLSIWGFTVLNVCVAVVFLGLYSMNVAIGLESQTKAVQLVVFFYEIQLQDGLNKIHHHLFILTVDQRLIGLRFGSGKSIVPDIIFKELSASRLSVELSEFQATFSSFFDDQKKKLQGTDSFDALKNLLETDICQKLPPLNGRYSDSSKAVFSKIIQECSAIHSNSLSHGSSALTRFSPCHIDSAQ